MDNKLKLYSNRLFELLCNKGMIQTRSFENPLRLSLKEYYDTEELIKTISHTVYKIDFDTATDKITVYKKFDLKLQVERIKYADYLYIKYYLHNDLEQWQILEMIFLRFILHYKHLYCYGVF